MRMVEPYATEFERLVRLGAGVRDIQGALEEVGYARRTLAPASFVAREIGRVELHQEGTVALLDAFAGRCPRVLDLGCSTGGSTVAVALSGVLSPEVVIGADPDPLSIRAAEVRARGYELDPKRVAFVRTTPGEPLPFADDSFDLVLNVSVLEFVPTAEGRKRLVSEMKRVVRPGGHVLLATPSPLRVRERHTRRLLGDYVRREGYPWATTPWALRAMVADFERVDIDAWLAGRLLERVGLKKTPVPAPVAKGLSWAWAWQKVLVRKPTSAAA
jgi:SAM-dependent methyltransferase